MSAHGGRGRLLVHVVRFRFALIGLLSLAFTAVDVSDGWRQGADWNFLSAGGATLLSSHADRLYLTNRGLQAGPLALLVIGVLLHSCGSLAPVAVRLLLALELPALLWLTERTAGFLSADDLASRRRSTVTVTVGGLLLTPVWAWLAGGTLHIDDGVALLAAAATLLYVARDSWLLAAVCAGAAVASKPWAVGAIGLLLALRSDRVRALAVGAAVTVAGYAVVLGRPANIRAASDQAFAVSPSSPMHMLHLAGTVAPAWQRPVELSAVLVVAAVVAMRSGCAAAFAASMTTRLVTEIATLSYYDVDTLVAVVAADVMMRRVPWRSVLAWLLVEVTPLFPAAAGGALRLAMLVVLLASYLPSPVAVQRRVAARWAALRPLLAS